MARQLADENTELFSIPQLVKEGKYEFMADEIGIVYPIYGQMPPNMVRGFIQKARLKADYKFAALTYGNMQFAAVGIWDEVSRKAGNAFDYITSILMVDNWLPNFDMNEQMKIDKHIPEKLETHHRRHCRPETRGAAHRRSGKTTVQPVLERPEA